MEQQLIQVQDVMQSLIFKNLLVERIILIRKERGEIILKIQKTQKGARLKRTPFDYLEESKLMMDIEQLSKECIAIFEKRSSLPMNVRNYIIRNFSTPCLIQALKVSQEVAKESEVKPVKKTKKAKANGK